MITAILSMVVLWCLLYGRLPSLPLALLCTGLGICLALLGRHTHTRFFAIDVLAQTSRLNTVSAGLKFWTVLVLLLLCVAARNVWVGLFLSLLMLLLTVFVGGLKLRDYMRLLALPLSFLMISSLVLLFEYSPQPTGLLHVPVFGSWLCLSPATQMRTGLVTARALGALSCLYLLSLSTPLSELIGVLRRARCPDVLIELMYLIYRYTFVLLNMYYTMLNAAKSRLGYTNYRAAMRTTGLLYANLLAHSYRQAGRNFDAMESRCFDTQIRFLERCKRISAAHAIACTATLLLTLGIFLGGFV